MSTVKVQGNAGGAGSITLASPNTNNNRTIELPDVDGTAVVANSSGNVGIGTSSPNATLETVVSGSTSSIRASADAATSSVGSARYSDDTSAPVFQLLKHRGTRATPSATSSGDNTGRILFYGYDGAASLPTAEIRSYVDGTQGTNDMPGRLSFWTTADGAASSTERARIDSSGNLLVGTTNGGTQNTNSMQYLVSNAQGYVTHVNGTSSGTGYWIFSYNGSAIGSITQNGTTAVAYNTTSDYRLKENVQPLSGALARIAALKPCTYTWKAAPDEIGEGFIAHELAEVCPQAVTGEKDAVDEDGNAKYQSIDTSFLVATLTAAIQEQQAIIADLKSRIETLEAK